jgi:hypothetical protein
VTHTKNKTYPQAKEESDIIYAEGMRLAVASSAQQWRDSG